VLFLLLQINSFQTYLGHKTADFLSTKLNTSVQIGSIEFGFYKRLIVNDVYIQDLHKDTIFYSKKLKFALDKIDAETHEIRVKDVMLLNTKSKIIKYAADDDFNFQFIIDSLDSGPKTTKKTSTSWKLKFGEVTFVNGDFSYKNEHDTLITTGINYFDLRTKNINGLFTDIEINHDTIRGSINYLSAIEKSGFILKNMSSYVRVSPIEIQLDELKITTPESKIATDLSFKYSRYRDFLDFVNKVKFSGEFERSELELNDISYFAPDLYGIFERLNVTGKISGTVKDLRGKDMNIELGSSTYFKGDVTLTGLPNIEETLIYLSVKNLTTNYKDLSQIPIPPFKSRKKLKVPENFKLLGNMSFDGTFTGLYSDFYAYGNFKTALGMLSSDLAVRYDDEKKIELYKGKIKSTAFDFGAFLGAKALGKATVDVAIKGEGITIEKLKATLDGNVNSVYFNGYDYQKIKISGDVANQIFKGKLNVADDNIDFDFIGTVDFTNKLPKLDFISTINKANLSALHFVNTTKKTNLSTQVIINVTGSNIDNLKGQINFDNTIYQFGSNTYKLSVFNLLSEEEDNMKSLKLFSDFADIKLKGNFKIMELPISFEKMIAHYLPSYFNTKIKTTAYQNFEYTIIFKKNQDVFKLFVPGLTVSAKTNFNGKVNSQTNQFELSGNSSSITYNNLNFKKINIQTTSKNTNTFDLLTNIELLKISDSVSFSNIDLNSKLHADSLNINLTWDNKTAKKTDGNIQSFLHFNNNKQIFCKILPSYFHVSDSLWAIDNNKNELLIDSSCFNFNDIMVKSNEQTIKLNGTISKNPTDQLFIELNNFNTQYLNIFTQPSGIKLKGTINGTTTISDVYSQFIFLSDNTFSNFIINDNLIGNGTVASIWDKKKEALYLHGKFNREEIPNILFAGYYYPNKQDENIDMDVNLQSIQMQLIQPFIKDYCADFTGLISGNASIKGHTNKPLITGKLNVDAKKITVNYLKTSYRFNHDILIENNSFGIENMVVYDMNNNKAYVNGKVYHDNFKNFQLDFDIFPNKFMCLNTTEIDNSLYYGNAYVTGLVNIFGYLNNIYIDANVKTEKITSQDKSDKINVLSKTEYTKIFIPLSKTSEVSDNSFITFVKKDTVKTNKNYEINLNGIRLNFDLEVTPDAEVQLVFDQKVGDVIKAKGTGIIKLNISSTGDFKMFGNYEIENGDYLFTLQNLINKKFDIENGSTIKWNGIPYKADLNINAIYKARASLKPFFPNDSSGIYKKRYPVDLKLSMTNDLLSPDINFDLALPTVDAGTRQQVMGYLNTETEMNRQVFSLLILNSFITPPQFNTGAGLDVANAAEANTFEILSNQLSNMLSKISKDFDIGINYRPGDAITKDELGVALSTQLFNDKLTIDGNVGVNNNNTNSNQNTNNIVGDVIIDYKLTDDGKVRIKAFNKANDNNNQFFTSGQYTQGIGVFYREEFDTIGELYKRYLSTVSNRRKSKKEEENK